ncbi:hypothetical protein NESM_000191100 [Novymonas esmeraldas]|uniref:Guanine nucleotide-binding protein subunit beta-like protein n=1 Tax=Novymonas esmeraldas TaxID=1808958 RepID=A0AAW0F6B7_9TRYP
MQASQENAVPHLAIIIGNAVSLVTLQQEWAAFPQGVSYAEFRQLLEPHVRPPPTPRASIRSSIALLHPRTPPRPGTSGSVRLTSASVSGRIPQRLFSATAAVPPSPADDTGTNREAERTRRLRSQQELAGQASGPVDPIKLLFNRVDVRNQQRVTWEDLVNYLVAEASIDTAGTKVGANAHNVYTYARRLRGLPKQAQQQRAPKEGTSADALAYKRYYRDLTEAARARGPRPDKGGGGGTADECGSVAAAREDEDLALIRFLDGLPGHKSLFFASTRSSSFILYSKDTLERVYTAPADLLGDVNPSAVAYLAACDLFLCYSPDDRQLRGWFSLLSHAVTTITITPLLLEGLVRRIQVMPQNSPTYSEYAETVFLGDSFGHILRVTAPRGRCGGMEFTVAQTYPNLHTRESGGLVDFCVFGEYLYSSGFDGRLVSTSLVTGQSSELGNVVNEHLTTLTYVPGHDWVVAATSCARELLWWEAHSHGTLPGTAFDAAGRGDHGACIIALVYVAAADHVVSADCEGVVKVWDAVSQRCVQSLRSNRVPQRHGGSLGGVSADEAKTLSTNTRTAAHASSSLLAGNLAGLFVNLGLLALLPAGAGQASHVGGPQCHSLVYCESTQELLCGFVSSIICWGLSSRANPLVCDPEEVCYDVLYDIRTRVFLLQSATQLSVWDGAHGHRVGVLNHTAQSGVRHAGADIKATCIDALGSRVFVSLSDGRVVVYATQGLAADASQCTPASATVWWHPRSFSGGRGGGGEAGEAVFVEQMHYSSLLRTWLAITSSGSLLVRIEEDEQVVLFSTVISVSASPLTLLRVSEELRLVAVADAERTVYVYDMQAWLDTPVTKRLGAFGGLVDMLFLDNAPALVTVHAGGVCRCWSCAPAMERFKLLGVVCHPQHPAPEAAAAALPEAQRGAADGVEKAQSLSSPGAGRGRPLPLPSSASHSRAAATSPAGSRDPLRITTTSDSPLIETNLPWVAYTSRPGSVRAATSRPATATLLRTSRHSWRVPPTRPTSGLDPPRPDGAPVSGEAGPAASELCLTNAASTFAALRDTGVGAAAATAAAAAAGDDDWASATAATIALDPCPEFTSAAYDGRRHHLFLGDADGVLHIFRMCSLLQAYQLPRCTHSSRPAFLLAAASETAPSSASPAVAAAAVATSPPPLLSSPAAVAALPSPQLIRSVQVHTNESGATEVALEASPASTWRSGSAPALRRGRDRRGVVCVRWITERGVLATSGHDHAVWFLSSEGERLACLSAERRPPRPESVGRPATASRPHRGTLTRLSGPVAGPQDVARTAGANDALSALHVFCLPPVPIEEHVIEPAAPAGTPTKARPPCCCTHHTTDMLSGVDELEGEGAVEEPPADPLHLQESGEDGVAGARSPTLAPRTGQAPTTFDPPSFSARPSRVSSGSLASSTSIPEATVTARQGSGEAVLSDFLQRPQSRGGARWESPSHDHPISPPSSLLLSMPPLPRQATAAASAMRGQRPISAHAISSITDNPLGSGERPCSAVSLASDGPHVHIADWQKRDLAAMREARGMKPQAPVRPGSPSTLVHVEESKGHSPAAVGQPLFLGPADGELWQAVRAPVPGAAEEVRGYAEEPPVAAEATGRLSGAAAVWTAMSITANTPDADKLLDAAVMAPLPASHSSTTDVMSFDAKEDTGTREPGQMVGRHHDGDTPTDAAMPLCVLGSGLAVSGAEVPSGRRARERKALFLPHLPTMQASSPPPPPPLPQPAAATPGFVAARRQPHRHAPAPPPAAAPATAHRRGVHAPPLTQRAKMRGGGTKGSASCTTAATSASASHQASAVSTPRCAVANPPPMLAYSSAHEGKATLALYANELRQCLRRPRLWDE